MSKYLGVISIVEISNNVHSGLGKQISGVLFKSNICSECIPYLFTKHNGEYVHHIYLDSEKLVTLQDVLGLTEIKDCLDSLLSSTQLYFDIDVDDNLGIYFGEISLTLFNSNKKEFYVEVLGQQDSTGAIDVNNINTYTFSSVSLDWLAKNLNLASSIFSTLYTLQSNPSQFGLENSNMLKEFIEDFKTIYTCFSLHHMCVNDRELAIKAVHSLFLQD